MKRVTVLMAVRDAPVDQLETAIGSIRAQTLSDFEFLILDDGSRSESTRACLERRAAEDPRIRLERGPGRGLTAALNAGLAMAQGELIARQDADDWSEPVRLARQVARFDAPPEIGLCGSDYWTHQRDGARLWRVRVPHSPDEILRGFSRGNPFVHGSAMFRRDAALEIGGYREEFPCSQDYDFFWRLAESWDAANLAEPLYHYRYSAGSVTAARAAEQARVHLAARRLAEARRRGEPEDVEAALRQAAEQIADGGGSLRAALKQADHRMLAGDYGEAWRAYLRLARENPASALVWAKMARWAVFVALPPAREMCFSAHPLTGRSRFGAGTEPGRPLGPAASGS